jgi:hypothetical protein
MKQIVDKMKNGAKLQSSEGKYYKTWLVFPDGSTEKISKKIANQIAIKYVDELIFGEHEGIRFRKIKYAMPEGINSKEDHEEYIEAMNNKESIEASDAKKVNESLAKQIVIKGQLSNEQMLDIINPIIDYADKHDLKLHIKSEPMDNSETMAQKIIELMQVLEMIEHVLQNENTITPDSFVIRASVRLAIGMDVLNSEKEDLLESVAKILNASKCVEKAIEFSNSHEDNEGAYLAYLAGARYMADFIEYKKNKKTK